MAKTDSIAANEKLVVPYELPGSGSLWVQVKSSQDVIVRLLATGRSIESASARQHGFGVLGHAGEKVTLEIETEGSGTAEVSYAAQAFTGVTPHA